MLGTNFTTSATIIIPGPPRQARQERFGPCLDFGFQYALIRNNRSKSFGVEYWTLPGSNLPWRPFYSIHGSELLDWVLNMAWVNLVWLNRSLRYSLILIWVLQWSMNTFIYHLCNPLPNGKYLKISCHVIFSCSKMIYFGYD